MEPIRKRQIVYALSSFLLGIWTFVKVSAISGPVFEPIIAACTNPDISVDDFASKTGYHAYEPMVGFKVFNVLVCLITQFLLELRQTYPAGILTWGGIMVVALPTTVITIHEAGRSGAWGLIRYPIITGLLSQLLGVSVIFPLIWIPSYIFGEGTRGGSLTNYRIVCSALLSLPAIILTAIVFSAPTDSYLWTICAGILGGPILALSSAILWKDASSSLPATAQNIKRSSRATKNVYTLLMFVGFVGWLVWVAIFYKSYGTSMGDLWNDIWIDATGAVAFMTIDTGVLYIGLLIFIAYRGSELKALKALLLTPVLGPATACCLVLKEFEDETIAKTLHELDSNQADRKKDD